MADKFDLVLRGGVVVNHDGERATDIGVRGGRVVTLGVLTHAEADSVVDCTGLHVLPGFIDSQVHFREPGLEHKEDLESGSRAAVMGGVTTVFEMPNTSPLTVSGPDLANKVWRGRHRMHCDFAFWVGGTHENANVVGELERLPGAAGIKVFAGSSTGSLLVEDDEGIRAILSNTRRRVAFHSEDEPMLRERAGLRREGDPRSHPEWRSKEVAIRSTERILRIAREVGAKVHILHISTAEEMSILAEYKDVATVEVTPHHLTLTDDAYDKIGTLAQMNPPVRDAANREGIWEGVRCGIVDVLGSDHAPHTLEEKARPYPSSPSGMTGVQTLVPIMLSHVRSGRLSLARLVDLTSAGPKRLFGVSRKGRLAVGYDADFTVVDLERRRPIENSWIASKSQWTPYDGRECHGWPVGTIVRGNVVMWEGNVTTPSIGEPVEFEDTLAPRE